MTESFSWQTKTDLCGQPLKGNAVRTALLYGILLCAEQFSKDRIVLETENEALQLLTDKLFSGLLHFPLPPFTDRRCEITEREPLDAIFSLFTDPAGNRINRKMFFGEPCRAAFVRGVFLACGTITEPENDYHLELLTRDPVLTSELEEILTGFGLPPKRLRRTSRQAESLYYKDSSAMEDFLNFIGAQKSAFRLMDVKILRDLRNNANRCANCDTANIDKTITAAQEQMDAILTIIDTGCVMELPVQLKETFDLRAAHPDATLAELVALHTGKISRSGVCHRLAKIVEFAGRCRKE